MCCNRWSIYLVNLDPSYQIRTIDKKRLIKKLGEIQHEDLKKAVVEALSFQLGLYS